MARRSKNYPPEIKERAIELCIRSIKLGWSVARFSRMSGIWRTTLLDWLSTDDVFDRYRRAMEQKALEIPMLHMDVIKRVIEGKLVKDPKTGKVRREFLDPKAARVAMQGLEFRMMREIKKIYEPTSRHQHDHKHDLSDVSDHELEAQKNALIEKEIAARQAKKDPDEDSPGPTIN